MVIISVRIMVGSERKIRIGYLKDFMLIKVEAGFRWNRTGLPIAKQIVEAHGGDIILNSQLGRTEVDVILP